MQAPAQAGQHLARKCRIAFQLVEHRCFGNMQQQRIGQRLRGNDIGLFHEHQRFAETVSGPDDFHHLFTALRRSERKFDLAIDDCMEADTRITPLKYNLAACDAHLGGPGRDAVQFRRRHLIEQREPGEKILHFDLACTHGCIFSVLARYNGTMFRTDAKHPDCRITCFSRKSYL